MLIGTFCKGRKRVQQEDKCKQCMSHRASWMKRGRGLRQEYSTTGARKQEAQCFRGPFTCRFLGEWTYMLGLGAGRCRGVGLTLPHQGLPMEPSLHGYLEISLQEGFACLLRAPLSSDIAGLTTYEQRHMNLILKSLLLSLCCLTWALRSAISLEPLPAGTVRTLGSFSSSWFL